MNEDDLMQELGELPRSSAPELGSGARATFVRAGDETSGIARLLGVAGRASVPVVLASVVGIYLSWAFATAIALVQ